ncbi:MAG: aminomethyltransferase family protein [Nocardioidaceae bacterium]
MVKRTPFHERLSELNTTGLFGHWSGFLSPLRYDTSAKHEYFGVRNSAGFFDSSPLYKHRITGPDAERFLGGVMARDVRVCTPGRAQYTVWCDGEGYLLEDGVLFRHAPDEFVLTCAEPNVGYLGDLATGHDVRIEDVSEQFAVLAVQGPRSREILATLSPDVARLRFFGLTPTTIAGVPVTVSRTGFTGDLGYELMIPADDALTVLDAVIAAGTPYGMRPFGEEALLMCRIEAGLVLIGVDFTSARYAYNDSERLTPIELGLGWLLRTIDDDSRPFIGRDALRRELEDKTSRWNTVGLVLDWAAYDGLYRDAGLTPPKDETPLPWESMLYDDAGERIGYAPSMMYSPVLQRHVAIALVKPEHAALGGTVHVEQTIQHEYTSCPATVTTLPLFNPARKTANI